MRPEMLLIAQEALRNDLTDRQEEQPSSSPTRMGMSKQVAHRSAVAQAAARPLRPIILGLTRIFTSGRVSAPWTL
jgi:hypothetical protein